MTKLKFVAGLVIAAVVGSGTWVAAADAAPSLPEGLDEGWYAVFETNRGSFVARLFPEQAPQTVAHFAAAAEGRLPWRDPLTGEMRETPYYDGIVVHKIAKGERIEAGDPTGTGRGAPLIYVPREIGPVDFTFPYRLGMTGSGGGRVSALLFFVTRTNQSFLNGKYPCFGEIVAGREVVDAICRVLVDLEDRPTEEIRLLRVRVLNVGEPSPLPAPVPYTPKTPKFGPKEP
jgi:Peptidyl-prolyl cis-trans isomerase (rotamase) - cyclophilin family